MVISNRKMQQVISAINRSRQIILKQRINSGLIFSIPLSLSGQTTFISLECEYAPEEFSNVCKRIGKMPVGYATIIGGMKNEKYRSEDKIVYMSDSFLFDLFLMKILRSSKVPLPNNIILTSCRTGTIGEGIILLWKILPEEKPRLICLEETTLLTSIEPADIIEFSHVEHPVRIREISRSPLYNPREDYEIIQAINKQFEGKVGILVIVANIQDAKRLKAQSRGSFSTIMEGGWESSWRGSTWDISSTLSEEKIITSGIDKGNIDVSSSRSFWKGIEEGKAK
mgnify:CR=1 FL=1